MISRTAVGISIVFLSASPAGSQTYPGLSFDQTVSASRPVNTAHDTSTTAVLHFLTSRGNIRVDIEGQAFPTGNLPMGKHHSVMLLTDSGAKVTFLNEDEKQYVSVNPVMMMEGMRKMLESMGGQIIIDTAGTRLTLDSLGAGPVVDGHPTLRYHLTTALRMSLSMRGTPSGFEEESVEDILVAPDVTDMADVTASMTRLMDMGQAMGMAPEFTERAKALQRKIPGLPLRVTKVQTVRTNGRTHTSSQDIVISNVRRVQVPSSAFAVPAGYTQVATPRLPSVNQ
jgi:hypothetical protein